MAACLEIFVHLQLRSHPGRDESKLRDGWFNKNINLTNVHKTNEIFKNVSLASIAFGRDRSACR